MPNARQTNAVQALNRPAPSETRHLAPETRIELRPISSLRPYAGNARVHSDKQIRQIAASIRRFGFMNPVLVSDAGEIIAGHGRVKAAQMLGLDEVPTLRLSLLICTEN